MLLVPIGVLVGTRAGDAHTQVTAQPFQCTAYPNTSLAGPADADQTLSFNVTAPDVVVQGQNFLVQISMDSQVVPTDFDGNGVNHIRSIVLKMPVPANSTYVSATLSGNTAGWSVSQSSGVVTLSTTNSYPGGSTITPPTVNLTLNASGAQFSVVHVRHGGNPPFNEANRGNPSYSLTANVNAPVIGALDVFVKCYADGAPPMSLHGTTIVPPDTTAPTPTITSPANGATYALGSTVLADFSCVDDTPYGTGVATCVGTNPDGVAIDTSSLGPHAFSVSTTDNAGNGPAVANVTYNVVDLPGVTLSGDWADETSGATVDIVVGVTRRPTSNVVVPYNTTSGTATEGTDFSDATGTLTFTPTGPRTQTVAVPVLTDPDYEGPETLDFNLGTVTGGIAVDTTIVGRIRDNDIPAVVVTGGEAFEGSPTAAVPFTIALAGQPNGPVTVNYGTSNGTALSTTDYTTTTGSHTFNPGDGPFSFTVPITTDSLWEADGETFDVTATIPASGGTDTARGEIFDNATGHQAIGISNATIREGDGTGSQAVKLTVSLEAPAAAPVTVFYSTQNISTEGTADYAPKINRSLTFTSGQVSKTVSIAVKRDSVSEGDEQLVVKLHGVTNARLKDPDGLITILDDDAVPTAAQLSVQDVKVLEGTSLGTAGDQKVYVTATLSQPLPTAVTFRLATANGTATAGSGLGDYIAANKPFTIKAGARSATLAITVNGDPIAEGDETFSVNITDAVGAPVGDAQGEVVMTETGGGSVPGAPTGVGASTSAMHSGGVDVSWTAPASDGGRMITEYQYRFSLNAGAFSNWTGTGAGDNTSFTHTCGQGNSCAYEIRAANLNGPGPAGASGSAAANRVLKKSDSTPFESASPQVSARRRTRACRSSAPC